MWRSANDQPLGVSAASAVAYLDERRARRLSSIGAQLEARDRAAARLREAILRYERHVLDWYAMGRPAEARAARAAIAGHERALLAAQSALAAPAPRRERAPTVAVPAWVGCEEMIDHLTLRVPSMESAAAPPSALEALDIAATVTAPGLVLGGNFGVSSARPDRPPSERIHVAFVAPTPEHVDRFAEAGLASGLADNGAPGPRPGYSEDYYGAFLLDDTGNNFEAVHRAGPQPPGTTDHVAIRVADAPAATAFYELIGDAGGLTVRRRREGRTTFSIASDGAFSVIAGEPSAHLHLAFVGDEPAVRRFHADAVAAGYRSNGDPGERPDYPQLSRT